MLSNTQLDTSFWAETLKYASHLMNRLSSTAKLGKTPLDIWSDGVTQDYDLLWALDDHPTSASKIPSKIREQRSSLFFLVSKGI